jgi:hypothetical protein
LVRFDIALEQTTVDAFDDRAFYFQVQLGQNHEVTNLQQALGEEKLVKARGLVEVAAHLRNDKCLAPIVNDYALGFQAFDEGCHFTVFFTDANLVFSILAALTQR